MLRHPLIEREEAPLTLPARINIEKNPISSSTSSSHRSYRVQETHFLSHLFLINVTITISFVPFHISCRTSSHSYCHSAHLSFGLIIFTRSGCIRKCIFSRKTIYYLHYFHIFQKCCTMLQFHPLSRAKNGRQKLFYLLLF